MCWKSDGSVSISIRKGASDSVQRHVEQLGGSVPAEALQAVDKIAHSGGTPLLVTLNDQVLGAVHLKDMVKGGIRERFFQLRRMGIRTIMITGDNPLTAAAIAAEAGVDDFIGMPLPKPSWHAYGRSRKRATS